MDITTNTLRGPIEMAVPADMPRQFIEAARSEHGYETGTQYVLVHVLDGTTTYYDVGSRWGYFVKFAARCGAVSCHAFERAETAVQYLRQNVHDDVAVSVTTVGDGTGDTLALDTYVAAQDGTERPQVLKVDVEGDEVAVLEGATDTLQTLDHVLVEAHPGLLQDRGLHLRDVVDRLYAADFDVVLIPDHRTVFDPEAAPTSEFGPVGECLLWGRRS